MPDEIAHGADGREAQALGLTEATPLWYYILKEAEVDPNVPEAERGQRLGDVGGAHVADVLVGLIAGDPTSFLSLNPNWTPGNDALVPDRGDRPVAATDVDRLTVLIL